MRKDVVCFLVPIVMCPPSIWCNYAVELQAQQFFSAISDDFRKCKGSNKMNREASQQKSVRIGKGVVLLHPLLAERTRR